MPRLVAGWAVVAMAIAVAGCGPRGVTTSRPLVVVGESFWGSLAGQLAGDRLAVRSIVVDPGTDPHSYEPSATDAVRVAQARLVVANGAGYDPWLSRLAAAGSTAALLDVGHVLGLRRGDNPHQWYSPSSVRRVIAALTADYTRIDPGDRAYFQARARSLTGHGLADYDRLRAEIRDRYRGVAVGYSESIFAPLGRDLALDLRTPPAFARAIAEGGELSPADRAQVDRQIAGHRISVWVVNAQNLTPDVQRLTSEAHRRAIPVVAVTETLTPPTASFQAWQASELERLERALREATGR